MEFRVNMVYEEEDFFSLASLSIKSKKGYMFNRVLSRLIGVIMFASIAFGLVFIIHNRMRYRSEIPMPDIIIYLMFMYFSYILIVGISGRRTSKHMWKKYDDKGSQVKFTFTEDYMMIETSKTEEKSKYIQIKKFYEYKERYFLFVNEYAAHIIRKDKFSEEEREKFVTLIQQKTNLKIITK